MNFRYQNKQIPFLSGVLAAFIILSLLLFGRDAFADEMNFLMEGDTDKVFQFEACRDTVRKNVIRCRVSNISGKPIYHNQYVWKTYLKNQAVAWASFPNGDLNLNEGYEILLGDSRAFDTIVINTNQKTSK